MRERLVRGAVVVAALVLSTGCASEDDRAPRSNPAAPPRSGDSFFFAGPPDDGARRWSPADRDWNAVSRAERRIELCGFVDADDPAPRSLGYLSFSSSDDFDSCVLFSGKADPRHKAQQSASLFLRPEREAPSGQLVESFDEGGFRVDVRGGQDGTSSCSAQFDLGLADLPGAPSAPEQSAYLRSLRLIVASYDDDDPCGHAKALGAMAARVRAKRGVPHRDERSPTRVAAFDPCSPLLDVQNIRGEPAVITGHSYPSWTCAFTESEPKGDGVYWNVDVKLFLAPPSMFARNDEAAAVKTLDGVRLYSHSASHTVLVPLDGAMVAPVRFDLTPPRPDEARVPVVSVSEPIPGSGFGNPRFAGTADLEKIAVAAAKRFGA